MTMLAAIVAVGGVQAAPPKPVDWTRTVATTPAGSYVMGNPRAKVKLVEYLSLSCSHCAAFAAEGLPALKRDYIARGLVSLEVRNAVRDGFDFAGVLASRCAGPVGYFPVSERILATQAAWMPKAEAYAQAQAGKPEPASEADALAGMGQAAGFDQLLRARGAAPARIKACLADRKQITTVTAMAKDAFETRKIPGTPAFLINGVLVPDTSNWALLQPKLAAALR
jgi:protein-disulfide isomerase